MTPVLPGPREGAGGQNAALRTLLGPGPNFLAQNLKLLWMKVPYRST